MIIALNLNTESYVNKFIRTDNTIFININEGKRGFCNSFSELLNALAFREKSLHMSRSLWFYMDTHENARNIWSLKIFALIFTRVILIKL